MEAIFWLALALVAFSYVGYPLVLAVWDGAREALAAVRFVSGGDDRRGRAAEGWPSVTLLFSAFDEEAWIRRKIENCLALDYPPDRLEIVVGCDGCTDRTAQIAREVGGGRVKVHALTPRAGKASVLSRLVPQARGDLVVLTDANVMLERGALRALARRFREPGVGAVVGRLRLFNPTRREFEESLYWKYETAIKFYEGKHGCVLGANGGIYAIRRILFSPLAPDTIVDDFVIPVRIAARGWEVPFEPEAVAFEETTEDAGHEFGRRARIGAGNWQALARVPELLDPRTGFLCFAFVSHKLLRWSAPFLLAAAAVANGLLAAAPGAWGYRALLLAQAAFYGLALAGRHGAAGLRGPVRRLASLAHYFVAMNAALAVGLWRFLRRSQRAAWQRTERAGPSIPAA
ncbi:glycosyl transferase family 2 [Anaeromyxobacter sp. K]|uniref:glycosyltransferase family 2 protein n=1 Tax=Anaeromyxobacter sp. (strain K) TaxID=447217 RepID=UPI00015F896D|nr:glycosyltransferase family 2 protein [Anaeromyxobacter sp. K]ACG73277.1 glycosyl transferase family 2 [Anaeromyxobacter sp. K]